MTTTPTTTTTTILVLYGSQTGNSEQAAHDFCHACTSEHLYDIYHTQDNNNNNNKSGDTTTTTSSTIITTTTHKKMKIIITTKCMSLDDFLDYEMNHCNFHDSTIMILFVSSYGMGGPPLGCYRFRDVCDCIMMQQMQQQSSSSSSSSHEITPTVISTKSNKNTTIHENISDTAKGIIHQLSFRHAMIHYAICGLGDSKYTTYMNNPTVIDTTLRDYLQATPICSMGHADASSSSWKVSSTNNSSDIKNNNEKKEQADVINEWIEHLWLPLSNVIYNHTSTAADTTMKTTKQPTQLLLLQLQHQLQQLCQEIIPDYHPAERMKKSSSSKPNGSINTTMAMITIVMVLISIVVAKFLL